jgi:hypothetical protein
MFETLVKHLKNNLKAIANICNIQMKYLQCTYKTPETLKTYVCNMYIYICNIQIYFCNI